MEKRISEIKDGNLEIIQAEEKRESKQKKKKKKQTNKKKNSYENYPPLIRKDNIRILGIPEGKEREKGTEYIYRNGNRKCPKPEVETRYTSP